MGAVCLRVVFSLSFCLFICLCFYFVGLLVFFFYFFVLFVYSVLFFVGRWIRGHVEESYDPDSTTDFILCVCLRFTKIKKTGGEMSSISFDKKRWLKEEEKEFLFQ